MVAPSTTPRSQSAVPNSSIRDRMKGKIGYEWKAIFKALACAESNHNGCVTKADFEDCCQKVGIRTITREDLNRLAARYGTEGNNEMLIDFVTMSKDMGLHMPSFNLVHKAVARKENIEKLRKMMHTPETRNRYEQLQTLISDYQLEEGAQNPFDGLALGARKTKSPSSRANSVVSPYQQTGRSLASGK